MFNYDMDGSITTILAMSELRNALLEEWPNLVATDINIISTEAELSTAVSVCTGRTSIQATEVVRNWMERHHFSPVDGKADLLRDFANQRWENEGGFSQSP